MIEVWTGTINEMTRAAAKPTQPAAVKWARDWLAGLKKQALIYENSAVEGIQFVMDDMGKVAHLTKGDVRAWTLDYMDIKVKVELRST